MERDRGKYNEPTEIVTEPTDPAKAFSYLLFGAITLSEYNKLDLAMKIALFDGETDKTKEMIHFLSKKMCLPDNYVDKIMGCLRNQECRSKLTQLIGTSPYFKPSSGKTNPPTKNE